MLVSVERAPADRERQENEANTSPTRWFQEVEWGSKNIFSLLGSTTYNSSPDPATGPVFFFLNNTVSFSPSHCHKPELSNHPQSNMCHMTLNHLPTAHSVYRSSCFHSHLDFLFSSRQGLGIIQTIFRLLILQPSIPDCWDYQGFFFFPFSFLCLWVYGLCVQMPRGQKRMSNLVELVLWKSSVLKH